MKKYPVLISAFRTSFDKGQRGWLRKVWRKSRELRIGAAVVAACAALIWTALNWPTFVLVGACAAVIVVSWRTIRRCKDGEEEDRDEEDETEVAEEG